MKLHQLNANESTELAKDYIEMARDGDLVGVTYDDQEDVVVINDEGAEYTVIKKDVPIGILNLFMKIVTG